MLNERHIQLLIEYRDGEPLCEPVHAELLPNGHYQLLFSPGLVQGIAAGDEFIVLNEDGAFEVTKRSGNVVVQVYSSTPVESFKEQLTAKVERLSGVLDGSLENGMVFTIPVTAGFSEIESVFDQFVEKTPGTEWMYGNVYNPQDGKTLLTWWINKEHE